MSERSYVLKDIRGGLDLYVFTERGSFNVFDVGYGWDYGDGSNLMFYYTRDKNEFLELESSHNIEATRGIYTEKALRKHLRDVMKELGIDELIDNVNSFNRTEIVNNFIGIFFEARAKRVVEELTSDREESFSGRLYSDGDVRLYLSKDTLQDLLYLFEEALKANGRYDTHLDELDTVYDMLTWFDTLTYAEAFDLMDINTLNLASYTISEMSSIFKEYTAVSLWIDVIIARVFDIFYALDKTIYDDYNRYFNN